MRMRFSDKGREKLAYLLDFETPLEDLEFWPDDFIGSVVLTAEEAKTVEELALLCLFLDPRTVTLEKAKVMKDLSSRIEQAGAKA